MRVTIIPQYHPAASLHAPRLLAVMIDDWEHMPEKVDAGYIVVEKPIVLYTCNVSLDTENNPDGSLGQWSIAWRDQAARLCVSPYYGASGLPYIDGVPTTIIMHNAKWDLRILDRNKIKYPPNVVDTMIAAYCLGLGRQDTKDTGRSGDQMVGGLGLKYLARRHLGMQMKSWNEIKDKPDEIPEYNAQDSVATLLLWEKWKDKLPDHFWKIDMPLLPVLMKMEDRGIMVDPDFLQRYAEALDEKLGNIDLTFAGEEINPFSHKQVSEYVYGALGYEPTKFTDNKQPSVDREVLETIDDPIVRRILEYREFYKEKKTYVSSYANKMDLGNRVHCEFKQTSTATGRLSSARPNLQNVTLNREWKTSPLRQLFIASQDKKLIRLDFKHIELRAFAAIAHEEKMLEVFGQGRDIHQETADFLGIPRPEARNVNFLMLYGGGAWKISQEFKVTIDKAKEMIAQYYKAYPGIKKYHEEMIAKAHEDRKVYNFFGRMRRLDGMYSEDWKTIKDSEREAINTPIQGTAAEVVKLAMIDLDQKHNAQMLLQVHDELLFEVDDKDAKEYALWLKEYVPTLTVINGVNFPVDVGVGQNWQESIDNEL